jgi:hypothetical protein
MPDDKKKRGKPDRSRISLSQAHERAYWSRRFGITQTDLRGIVKLVGPMVKDVKLFLHIRIDEA